MPQMAPISWLILFMIFSMSFILFNILNYYCINSMMNSIKDNKKHTLNELNWKW